MIKNNKHKESHWLEGQGDGTTQSGWRTEGERRVTQPTEEPRCVSMVQNRCSGWRKGKGGVKEGSALPLLLQCCKLTGKTKIIYKSGIYAGKKGVVV